MKDIVLYIYEKNGISTDINILVDYIYNLIKDYVYQESNDDKTSWLWQQYKEYGDDYPIEINFSDIDKFNQKRYNLQTYREMGPDYADYDCDMIVNIGKMQRYGLMDSKEPLLHINANFIKTKEIFEKNKTNIKNTLAHELTHYVQYQANGGTHLKFTSGAVSKELIDNTKGNMRYYLINFLLYVLNPIEMDARKMGLYQTMSEEIETRLREYKQLNKETEFNKDDFINFCLYHKDYENDVLHTKYFDLVDKAIEEDTWGKYQLCIDDIDNKYRDDSIIYVLLNICDCRETRPHLPMPSKTNYVRAINSKSKFELYQSKLLRHYRKNIKNHKNKLKKVIELVLNEKHLI